MYTMKNRMETITKFEKMKSVTKLEKIIAYNYVWLIAGQNP